MIAEEKGYTQITDLLKKAVAKSYTMDPVPPAFICPITCDLFKDPVMLGITGHTFERKAITDWLRVKKSDPLTNARLKNTTLVPNYALLDAVNDYVRSTREATRRKLDDYIGGEVEVEEKEASKRARNHR